MGEWVTERVGYVSERVGYVTERVGYVTERWDAPANDGNRWVRSKRSEGIF